MDRMYSCLGILPYIGTEYSHPPSSPGDACVWGLQDHMRGKKCQEHKADYSSNIPFPSNPTPLVIKNVVPVKPGAVICKI